MALGGLGRGSGDNMYSKTCIQLDVRDGAGVGRGMGIIKSSQLVFI